MTDFRLEIVFCCSIQNCEIFLMLILIRNWAFLHHVCVWSQSSCLLLKIKLVIVNHFHMIQLSFSTKKVLRCWEGTEKVLRCRTGAEVPSRCWGAGGSKSALSPLVYSGQKNLEKIIHTSLGRLSRTSDRFQRKLTQRALRLAL